MYQTDSKLTKSSPVKPNRVWPSNAQNKDRSPDLRDSAHAAGQTY